MERYSSLILKDHESYNFFYGQVSFNIKRKDEIQDLVLIFTLANKLRLPFVVYPFMFLQEYLFYPNIYGEQVNKLGEYLPEHYKNDIKFKILDTRLIPDIETYLNYLSDEKFEEFKDNHQDEILGVFYSITMLLMLGSRNMSPLNILYDEKVDQFYIIETDKIKSDYPMLTRLKTKYVFFSKHLRISSKLFKILEDLGGSRVLTKISKIVLESKNEEINKDLEKIGFYKLYEVVKEEKWFKSGHIQDLEKDLKVQCVDIYDRPTYLMKHPEEIINERKSVLNKYGEDLRNHIPLKIKKKDFFFRKYQETELMKFLSYFIRIGDLENSVKALSLIEADYYSQNYKYILGIIACQYVGIANPRVVSVICKNVMEEKQNYIVELIVLVESKKSRLSNQYYKFYGDEFSMKKLKDNNFFMVDFKDDEHDRNFRNRNSFRIKNSDNNQLYSEILKVTGNKVKSKPYLNYQIDKKTIPKINKLSLNFYIALMFSDPSAFYWGFKLLELNDKFFWERIIDVYKFITENYFGKEYEDMRMFRDFYYLVDSKYKKTICKHCIIILLMSSRPKGIKILAKETELFLDEEEIEKCLELRENIVDKKIIPNFFVEENELGQKKLNNIEKNWEDKILNSIVGL